jgi:hypothetical protein
MRRDRRGFTLIELFYVAVVVVVLLFVGVGTWATVSLWGRVSKLNTWAVATDTWLMNELWPWIRDNSFNGGGNPDGDKPPPPPDGLD